MNYRNVNQGLIWSNDRKKKDTQPEFKGTLNVKGEEFWISAWKRKEATNPEVECLSFSVRPKDETTIEQPKDYVVKTDNQ